MRIIEIHMLNQVGRCKEEETFTLEFSNGTTDKEIEKVASEHYENWMSNFDSGVSWEEVSEK